MLPTWENSKHLLAADDGSATEIILTGLPITQLQVVISALSSLPELEVISFDSETFENSETFDADWRIRLETVPDHNCQHSLRSACGTAQHLQVYLWIDVSAKLVELDLVFWNDLTFPPGLAVEEYEQRLLSLCSLVEDCRAGVKNSKCILTPEYNGPISELEKHDYIVQW
ncbi:hypothetical protein [Chitinimonas koreensis]|uniref:hypothetical protein n=1 Tax=Chitinimonas koreensis TaxID=356302 RepID=UPI0012FCE161|nr:hypothetical protein [Chitinimonas koreensis]QNM98823.1 hypothetical protein H9L41_11795 [Chitinimonas koreensis]